MTALDEQGAELHDEHGEHSLAALCRLTSGEAVRVLAYLDGRCPEMLAEALSVVRGKGGQR